MNRGIRSFEKLTCDDNPVLKKYLQKGRSKELIIFRNIILAYRYYYYAKIHNLKYDVIINTLAFEFALSPRTLTNILMQNNDVVKSVFEEKPAITVLRNKYDFLNWKYK